VRPSNGHVVDFYDGLGYEEVGRKREYYKDGEEAIFMRKILTN